jgi:predicted membrane channel-forming protein YqfA (hemolysin III family)
MLAAYFMLTSQSDVTVRVLVALYFAGAIFCLGASTVFHAFNCYSEAAYRLLIKCVVWLVIDRFTLWFAHAERFALIYAVMLQFLALLWRSS